MRRKSERPLSPKYGIRLYAEDWEKLAIMHPDLGIQRVIRELVHSHIRRVEERASQVARPLSQTEIDDIL